MRVKGGKFFVCDLCGIVTYLRLFYILCNIIIVFGPFY